MVDWLGDFLDGHQPKPKPEKGTQLHGRKLDGRYYVRAADVAALLDLNHVLPVVAKALREADDR